MSTTPTRWAQDCGLVAADRGLLSTNARLILMLLCERVDENWSVDMAITGQLDRIAGLHRNVVSRALNQLVELNVLSRYRGRDQRGRVGATQFLMRPCVLAELLHPYGEAVPAHILDNVVSTAKDVDYLMDSVAECVRAVFIHRAKESRGYYWERPEPYALGTPWPGENVSEAAPCTDAPCTSDDVSAQNTPELVHGDHHAPCTSESEEAAPCTDKVHGEIRENPGFSQTRENTTRTRTRTYTRAHTDHDLDLDLSSGRETKSGTSPAWDAEKAMTAAQAFIADLDESVTLADLSHRGVDITSLAAGLPQLGTQPIQVWQAIIDVVLDRAERYGKSIKRRQGYVSASVSKDPVGLLAEARGRVFTAARAGQLAPQQPDTTTGTQPAPEEAGEWTMRELMTQRVRCTNHRDWEGPLGATCPACRADFICGDTNEIPEPQLVPQRHPHHVAPEPAF